MLPVVWAIETSILVEHKEWIGRGTQERGIGFGLIKAGYRLPSHYRYGYYFFLIASRISFSLVLPVSLLIFSSGTFGPYPGIGLGRFLFNVSLRFC